MIQLVVGATIAAGAPRRCSTGRPRSSARSRSGSPAWSLPCSPCSARLAIAVADVLSSITGSKAQHTVGTNTYNVLAVAGWVGVAGTVFLTIGALGVAARRFSQDDTEPDPWGVGQTLEWATASPPAYENFVEIPPVGSESPLLDSLSVDLEVAR